MEKENFKRQCAALPFRFDNGALKILLVTSRETRRWILPKGWREKKDKPQETAANEAFEEAGVRGKVKKKPLGAYYYEKRLDAGGVALCHVSVYALEVTAELNDWPEKGQRERRWVTPSQAAMMISESGLVSLLLNLGLPEKDK